MGEHDYPVIEATQVNVNTVTEQKEHICAKPRTPSRRIHNWSKPLHLTCHVLVGCTIGRFDASDTIPITTSLF